MFLASKSKYFILLAVGLLWSNVSFSQDDKTKKKEDESFLNYEEPDFLLTQDSVKIVTKKAKKRKKKTFNGLKTKRGFTRTGQGSKQTVELFYYLKKHRDPNPYVSPIFVFDVLKQNLIELKTYSKKDYPPKLFKILHGPYKVMKDTSITQIGYFYIGTKHHRWETYGNEDIIIKKEKYYKGWPGNSQISYYDAMKTKIKEGVPVMFGEQTGWYYAFYENGDVKEKGQYADGIKIGRWDEYWPNNKKKKTVEYPRTPYEKPYEEKLIGEWNADGTPIGGEDVTKKKNKLGGGK